MKLRTSQWADDIHALLRGCINKGKRNVCINNTANNNVTVLKCVNPYYSISMLQIFSTKKTKRAVEKMKSLRGNNLTKKTV